MRRQLIDGRSGDIELSTLASGMDQANRRSAWIDHVNGAAIGNVDPERDLALVGDESVAPVKMNVGFHWPIDNCNFVAVNLFGGEQRPFGHADCLANVGVSDLESPERLGFILRHVNPGNSPGEDVTATFDRSERGKLLDWKLLLRHSVKQWQAWNSAARYFEKPCLRSSVTVVRVVSSEVRVCLRFPVAVVPLLVS